MALLNDDKRYGTIAKAWHWGAVALLIVLFGLGWTMTELPLGVEKFERYNLHKSVGVTLLLLMLFRLVWRIVSPPPPLPDSLSDGMRRMAALGHWSLYLALFAQIGVGLVHSWSANFPVVVFGKLALPSLTAPNEGLKEILAVIHYWGGMALLVLIAGHIGAALYHHFLRRDTVLKRMIPWAKI